MTDEKDNENYLRPMTEKPEKYPVLIVDKNGIYEIIQGEVEFCTYYSKTYIAGWQPLEILKPAPGPKPKTLEEQDEEFIAKNLKELERSGMVYEYRPDDLVKATIKLTLKYERERNQVKP